jgi:hypothetical protein
MNWERPVFIVACTNSGTKLLQKIMSDHDDLNLFPVEAHYLGFAPNLHGRLNRMFALWPCFSSSFADTATNFYSPETGPLNRESFIAGIESYLKMKCDVDPAADPRRPLIKEPKFSLRIPWLLSMFPKATIVCLVRNPWAAIEGIRRRQPMIGDLPLRLDIPTCTAQWLITNTIMQMSSDDSRCFFIRYEDIIDRGRDGIFWSNFSDKLGLSKPFQSVSRSIHLDRTKSTDSFKNLNDWEKLFIYLSCRSLIKIYNYDSIAKKFFSENKDQA